MTAAPGDDPRAFAMADADGKPITVSASADGNAWLNVGGETARLTADQAHRLGARVMGAGRRAVSLKALAPLSTAERPAAPQQG